MYEVEVVECAGIPRTEYRYEPEVIDDEPIEVPLTCSQCDHFRVWGECAYLGLPRPSTSLACSMLLVTSPF